MKSTKHVSWEIIVMLLLCLVLVTLKLSGILTISWTWALAPIWIPLALVAFFLMLMFFLVLTFVLMRR